MDATYLHSRVQALARHHSGRLLGLVEGPEEAEEATQAVFAGAGESGRAVAVTVAAETQMNLFAVAEAPLQAMRIGRPLDVGRTTALPATRPQRRPRGGLLQKMR